MARVRGCCLSQTLQEDLCRAADFLQLFHGACGLKGEVGLHLESCARREMAGVGWGGWSGCGAGGGRWTIWERCQQEAEDKDLIWAHMLSLWKCLGLAGGGWGKGKGRRKAKKGRSGRKNKPPAREPGFSCIGSTHRLRWERGQSGPKDSVSGSLLGRREMVRGTERGEASSRQLSPTVGDVKGEASPSCRRAEISLGSLECPFAKAMKASSLSLDWAGAQTYGSSRKKTAQGS